MHAAAPPLYREQLAPSFALPASDGTVVSRRQFRGRRNLVLVLFAPGDPIEGLLSGLAERAERLERLNAEVLAVAPAREEELAPLADRLGTPFRVLGDSEGKLLPLLTAVENGRPLPAVVVLDRWGAIQRRWTAPHLPAPEDVLGELERLEIACPECGVEHWNPGDWPA